MNINDDIMKSGRNRICDQPDFMVVAALVRSFGGFSNENGHTQSFMAPRYCDAYHL